MKDSSSKFGLPLLARELVEQAARKRTYVIRIGYAVTLFILVLMQSQDAISSGQQGLQALGAGAGVFDRLFSWQLLGVFVIMPIITCSAIAHEKERDTLQLLLVTHLRPATILLEKLLSRVLVMSSMLVMSLPMMAYAFSLGGVTENQIYGGMFILLTTTVYVGSFTLMCSSLCSSTVSAFICTILLGLPFIGLTSSCMLSSVTRGWEDNAFIGTAISQIFYSVLFFVIALAFLVERAMQPPRNILLQVFRGIDRFFTDLNENTTGGIVLVRDRDTLPNNEPIVWRETQKKSLGTFRYLVRILVVIELPTVLILSLTDFRFQGRRLGTMVMFLWTIAIVLVTTKVASIVSGERGRQTLDVLLTTPLTSREVIIQHMKGVQRLKWVLRLPLLTVVGFRVYWNPFDAAMMAYVVGTAVALFIFFELCGWISMLIGLAVKSQMKALVLSVVVVFGASLVPVILTRGSLLQLSGQGTEANFGAIVYSLMSPVTLIQFLERGAASFAMIFAHAIFYGAILFAVRWFCLHNADQWLGRCDDNNYIEPEASSPPLIAITDS